MKKTILFSLLVIIAVLGINQSAYAASPMLSVLPASSGSTVGAPFNVSIKLDPAVEKICVIKGNLSFYNLTCRNVTVASDIVTQKSPTCASPSFILGIPKCAVTSQNLFSVSVKGIQAGQAALAFSGLETIGAGTDVLSNWQGGSYNITAIPVEETPETVQPEQPVEPGRPIQLEQELNQENTAPAQETTSENMSAGVGTASLQLVGSRWFKILLTVLIIFAAAYAIYYFGFAKRTKKEGEPVKPEEPTKPEESVKPEEPTKPEEPVRPEEEKKPEVQ